MIVPCLFAVAHADPTLETDLAEGTEAWGEDDDWSGGPMVDDEPGPASVVGGDPVKKGDWDDAVGIVMFGQVACTGTLIGPKVVLTAQHCTAYPITDVLVGSKDWTREQGKLYEVAKVVPFPNGLQTSDVALVLLKNEVEGVRPRPIALECVLRDHLEDGAPVQIVGYGLTTESGTGFNSKLNEASSVVLDKNCNENVINGVIAGCNASVSPGGEIAAGGNGTDACFGDSGGPLYLTTDDGDFLVGVTSRAFLGVPRNAPCRDGGIWARPDAVIDWIEDNIGSRSIVYPSCNAPPVPTAEPVVTHRNKSGSTRIEVADPDGDPSLASWYVAVEPEHGTAEIDEDGVLTYVPDDGFAGEDVVVVGVTDGGNPDWKRTGGPVTAEIEIPIQVLEGCAGCDSTGAPGWLGVAGLAGLLARRRR
ncbi:MAG: trypsin-like serine protease [Alphaproteobacteria bacterium]|nr:trypsin-like serine protease [Alphaproteobacteria bacterium]